MIYKLDFEGSVAVWTPPKIGTVCKFSTKAMFFILEYPNSSRTDILIDYVKRSENPWYSEKSIIFKLDFEGSVAAWPPKNIFSGTSENSPQKLCFLYPNSSRAGIFIYCAKKNFFCRGCATLRPPSLIKSTRRLNQLGSKCSLYRSKFGFLWETLRGHILSKKIIHQHTF